MCFVVQKKLQLVHNELMAVQLNSHSVQLELTVMPPAMRPVQIVVIGFQHTSSLVQNERTAVRKAWAIVRHSRAPVQNGGSARQPEVQVAPTSSDEIGRASCRERV